MYAIVRTGGKQLKVAEGDVVRIEKPAGDTIKKGETLALSGGSVILVSGDGGVRTGADALKGGGSGVPAIVPGKSSQSLLIKYVSGEDRDVIMPPAGDRLKPPEIALLRAWIDGGAPWPGEDGAPLPRIRILGTRAFIGRSIRPMSGSCNKGSCSTKH